MASKLIALMGTPLGQSFAPRIQNEAYAAMGWDTHYFLVETDRTLLKNNIMNFKKDPSFAGLVVTKPNKEEAVQYMDELDPLAEKMGTINTIVRREDGTLKGYNTDGYGATKSMALEGIDFTKNTFFVWGAGGTGKSVCFSMADLGAKKIYISSRSEKCEILAADLNEKFGRNVAEAIRVIDEEAVIKAVDESDVLVNLSGLGMLTHEDETPIDKKYIKPSHICFDATYNPIRTRFLKEAEEKGCHVINGNDMSIYQGARQIEIWTGKEPPVETMRQTTYNIMAGK